MSSTTFDDSSKVERVANSRSYERAQVEVTGENIFRVDGYEAAAVKASELGRDIFVTTGNRNLKTFVEGRTRCKFRRLELQSSA